MSESYASETETVHAVFGPPVNPLIGDPKVVVEGAVVTGVTAAGTVGRYEVVRVLDLVDWQSIHEKTWNRIVQHGLDDFDGDELALAYVRKVNARRKRVRSLKSSTSQSGGSRTTVKAST